MTRSGVRVDEEVRWLCEAGVAEAMADTLVSDGLVARLDDHLLVVSQYVDAITGSRQALVPFGADATVTDRNALAQLASMVAERLPGTTELILTIRPEVRPPVGQPYLRYVVAGPSVRRLLPQDGWTVRPSTRSDAADVIALLERALLDGYAEAGADPDGTVVHDVAEDLFATSLSDGWGHVTHSGGTFVGHVTVLPDQDELTGQARWEMFDMFVLPEWRSGPAAGLLVSAAATRAAETGLPLRGHVSGCGPHSDLVLAGLVAQGWCAETVYWSIDLAELAR
jgi:GNAT superfamily N-acetyltransferase